METIISAFLLVFLAEMGDKTQFLALIFATKYKIHQVLIGVAIGVLANHGLAVILAYFLSSVINIGILKIIAGIMFLLFGFEAFILKKDDDEEEDIKYKWGSIVTVAVCFFIGELGDKTQITTMSIVFTGKNPVLTLIGTTSAMICVSAIGIIIGKVLKGKIPQDLMKNISGIVFLVFGIDALRKSIPFNMLSKLNIAIFITLFCLVSIVIFVRNKKFKESQNNE